ncbi:MAG: hypothetical protein JXA21_02575 [Anaerolineae bacterium]|nr:hypothetical protein [Anaerolineae bacterium]
MAARAGNCHDPRPVRKSHLYIRPGHILIGLGLLGLLTVYGILPAFRASLVVHPTRKPLPASNTLPFECEDAVCTTPEGTQIYGWYVPSRNHAAVILAHGYNGNRADYLEPAQMLAENGYGVRRSRCY